MGQQFSVVSTLDELRQNIKDAKQGNRRVALVPTMGALHEGHLSLIKFAKRHADYVVCSIFVNPTQFGPNEDLDRYPRPLERDLKALQTLQTDLVFTPSVDDVYPQGFQTSISVPKLSLGLCGGARPGHFDGVATVVCKLLLMALPDVAIFGEKDFQQLLVIQRMVEDLNIPTCILGAPIVRDDDGLALSSRNQYLTADERVIAPVLYQSLQQIAKGLRQEASVQDQIEFGKSRLEEAGFVVDYLELRAVGDLAPLTHIETGTNEADTKARLFAAAFLGSTRLIDNVPV